MEDSLMKKITTISAAVAALALLASCAREDYSPAGSDPSAGRVQTLTATFAPGETRTFFDGATFKWKSDDAILVRSDNAEGYTVYNNTSGNSAGSVTFEAASDDNITYGDESYAVYPNYVNDGCPKIEEGILKLYPKTTYTWSEGTVQAPMIAKVVSGEDLQFTHMGGLLKVTYKNVPPKARYIKVTAPIDATHFYKISQTMGPGGIIGWEDGAGFTLDKPYFKAYNNGKTNEYSVKIDINSATAAQRASDNGITAYVPLPVGPTVVSEKNVYPSLKISLTFADGTEVPGSMRTATNVQIERAHIKPMPAIVLTKYSASVLAGTDGSKAPDTEGKLNNVRGLVRASDGNLILMESAGSSTRSLRFISVSDGTVTTFRDNSQLGDPWHGTIYGNYLFFADKSKGKVFSMDLTAGTKSVTEVKSGLSQLMDVKYDTDGNAYALLRDTGIYKYAGGFGGAQSVFAPLASFGTGVYLLCMGFDPTGNLLVGTGASSADNTNGYKIYKVDTSGNVTCIAGTGVKATSYAETMDGAALTSAKFTANLQGITFDASGNVFVTDNVDIRKITVTTPGDYEGAIVTTIMGGGSSYTSATGAVAAFSSLQDIVFSADYSTLYISDQGRGTVRKINIE